jgi:hypothetical protein
MKITLVGRLVIDLTKDDVDKILDDTRIPDQYGDRAAINYYVRNFFFDTLALEFHVKAVRLNDDGSAKVIVCPVRKNIM